MAPLPGLSRVGAAIRRLRWRLAGRRSLTVFGQRLHMHPDADLPYDMVVRLPSDGVTSDIVRYADLVQMQSVALHLARCGPAPVVVDVGAHHGAYALLAGKLVEPSGGRVLAVEPAPEAFDMLQTNVRLNRLGHVVTCVQAAVQDAAGRVRIGAHGSESRIDGTPDASGAWVKATTLEELFAAHDVRRVDLLIVDVEGAELPVLRGFPWASVPVERIFCELHPYAWPDFGYDGGDVREFLHARDYRCFDMYMQEHTQFEGRTYIGPVRFVPAQTRNP